MLDRRSLLRAVAAPGRPASTPADWRCWVVGPCRSRCAKSPPPVIGRAAAGQTTTRLSPGSTASVRHPDAQASAPHHHRPTPNPPLAPLRTPTPVRAAQTLLLSGGRHRPGDAPGGVRPNEGRCLPQPGAPAGEAPWPWPLGACAQSAACLQLFSRRFTDPEDQEAVIQVSCPSILVA